MILAKIRDFAYAGPQDKSFRLEADRRRIRGGGNTPGFGHRGAIPRNRMHLMLQVSIIWLVVLSLLLAYVGERTLVMKLTYELKDLQGDLARVRTENDQLFLELTRLNSLDRIEQIARVQLNMISPRQVELLAVAPAPHPTNQVLARSGGEEDRRKGSWARAAERLQSFFGTVARARQASAQGGWVPASSTNQLSGAK
ncbi:MAG: FtsB family cell division protein [Syntrophothermus sp.]